jgi:hypothetical protein
MPDICLAYLGKRFQGIEAEVQLLGALRDPVRMGEVLARNKVALASPRIVEDWQGERETDGERAAADWIIRYPSENVPDTLRNVSPMPGEDRRELEERQSN